MSRHQSWDGKIFARLYEVDPDPWSFTSSAYEREKYAASLRALPRRRFAHALEIGCSIGVFTRRLAPRCDLLLALDIASAAVSATRRRCRGQHVRVARRRLPGQWPPGSFDLIVISEVLYFMAADDIARVARRARATLRPGGAILLVNWTGPTDTPLTGDATARLFMRVARLPRRPTRVRPFYRLDLLSLPARA